jgi:hypothetical protein
MRNHLLYIAASLDEVYETAYSIIKYLEVYNLKPPADHKLVVYTNHPDLLEVYGSFFSEYEFRPLSANMDKNAIVNEFSSRADGEVLYMDPNSYPVNKLEEQPDRNIKRYKDLKEFKLLLKDFFGRYQEESVPNQVKLMHNIDAKKIETEKRDFERLPLTSKWLRKLMGKGWSIANYQVRI